MRNRPGFCFAGLAQINPARQLHLGMKDIKFIAILVGVVVEYLITIVATIVMVTLMIVYYLPEKHVPANELHRFIHQTMHSLPALIASLVLGAIGPLIGGFVTGWMAKSSRIKNALFMGVISTIPGFFFMSEFPAWYDALSLLFTIGPAAVGGYFAQCLFGSRQASGE
jgi:hypothetical protein